MGKVLLLLDRPSYLCATPKDSEITIHIYVQLQKIQKLPYIFMCNSQRLRYYHTYLCATPKVQKLPYIFMCDSQCVGQYDVFNCSITLQVHHNKSVIVYWWTVICRCRQNNFFQNSYLKFCFGHTHNSFLFIGLYQNF